MTGRGARSPSGRRRFRRGAGSPGGCWGTAGRRSRRGEITSAESARHNGISWPSARGAFAEKADAVLGEDIAEVAHLGIDEHRRGRA
jgi:hypothetical protein